MQEGAQGALSPAVDCILYCMLGSRYTRKRQPCVSKGQILFGSSQIFLEDVLACALQMYSQRQAYSEYNVTSL